VAPRGVAPADSGAGWRRDDSARLPADRGLETRAVSRPRSQTRSSGGLVADEEASAALEAATAVAMAQGSGELQSADARDVSRVSSRRGVPRTGAAPAGNWSEAGEGHGGRGLSDDSARAAQ
jgi:hypothetical protein